MFYAVLWGLNFGEDPSSTYTAYSTNTRTHTHTICWFSFFTLVLSPGISVHSRIPRPAVFNQHFGHECKWHIQGMHTTPRRPGNFSNEVLIRPATSTLERGIDFFWEGKQDKRKHQYISGWCQKSNMRKVSTGRIQNALSALIQLILHTQPEDVPPCLYCQFVHAHPCIFYQINLRDTQGWHR